MFQALGHELMQPGAVAVFVESFTAEWNRLSAGMIVQSDLKQRELDGGSRKLNGLIDAIADGLRAPDLQRRLDDLAVRMSALGGGAGAGLQVDLSTQASSGAR